MKIPIGIEALNQPIYMTEEKKEHGIPCKHNYTMRYNRMIIGKRGGVCVCVVSLRRRVYIVYMLRSCYFDHACMCCVQYFEDSGSGYGGNRMILRCDAADG